MNLIFTKKNYAGHKIETPICYLKLKNSGILNRVAYNPNTEEFLAEFHGGKVYVYDGVPMVLFDRFATTRSYGSFLNKEIKNKYPFRKLEVLPDYVKWDD